MNEQQVIDAVLTYGDATITYRSTESHKLKYNVCTLDFDNPYIQSKPNRAKRTDDSLLFFCWDVDAYRLLSPSKITNVSPVISKKDLQDAGR